MLLLPIAHTSESDAQTAFQPERLPDGASAWGRLLVSYFKLQVRETCMIHSMSRMTMFFKLCVFIAVTSISLNADDVPGPLKSGFVMGDPVWKEIPIRED